VGQEGCYHLVGAKGYLLGDEGSGYWIGLEGLRAVIRAADGRGRKTMLVEAMLGRLELKVPDDLLAWLYQSGGSRTRDVAKLAGVVMEQAAGGDAVSQDIVLRAAQELALAVRAIQLILKREALPIAFAGGLLTHDTPLSRSLCDLIGLAEAPQPQYTPVIGGAIMALEGLGLRTSGR
jgi:N-acetylglucosamine kinase-like BadF-type ATPase